MGIDYLDGMRLKKAVIAAAHRVLDLQERLNKINVFPVADGDTGTNMALTLKHVADGAINAGKLGLDDMSLNLAESALMGARGNSGAILAQFFQGLAVGFHKHRRVGFCEFVNAAKTAVSHAENALEDPQAGTILTVMRDWVEQLQLYAQSVVDFSMPLKESLRAARESLRKTPEQLEVLAQAGVVDAGAQGFVHMLEGVHQLMETGDIAWQVSESAVAEPTPNIQHNPERITFPYCTECLVEGTDLESQSLRKVLAPFGDSLIVAGSSHKLKIHIHTAEPERLFKEVARFGRVSQHKAEDMRQQHFYEHGTDTSPIALVVDSSCDLPTDFLIRHKIRLVPVTVSLDNQVFLDRVNITAEEVYRQVGLGKWPKTSQPAPASFHQAFSLAGEHYNQVIGLFISGKISGTYQAAKLAARSFPHLDIRVIDSHTVAGCMGLLARVAVAAIVAGKSLDEVEQEVLEARAHTRLFATFPTLDHLVRGGRISKTRGMFARLFGLVPILSFDREGNIEALAKARTGAASWKRALKLAQAFTGDEPNPQFVVCHADNPEVATFYCEALKNAYQLDRVDVLSISPTVGAHVGLGAACVCCYLPTHPNREKP